MIDRIEILNLLISAVNVSIRAGALIMDVYNSDDFQVNLKSDKTPLTLADRLAHDIIKNDLSKTLIPVLSEEGRNIVYEERKGWEYFWIVDPLDGTLNFVQGFPHWCVSVALWDAAGPVTGCVWDPLRQDLFLAVRDEGATWNGQPMTISQQPGLDGAFVATGFAFQLGERFQSYAVALSSVFYRAKGIRRAGSAALDLAHTAAGIYDGFFELGLKKWDFAAGALLVKEAGGLVSDWNGGDSWFQQGDLVAGNLFVQQDLVSVFKN